VGNKCMSIKGLALISALVIAGPAVAQTAFTIAGTKTSVEAVAKEDQAAFYDLEKKKYELIEQVAKEKYLDYFWNKTAKESGKSVAAARADYEKKNLKIAEAEVKETLDKFKEHPSL